MATWNEVKQKEAFINATPEKQLAIRDDFFERVIAPKAQGMGKDVEFIRQDFYSRSGLEAPTRTGRDAALPDEAFYDAEDDIDGMPTVPAIAADRVEPEVSMEQQFESNWELPDVPQVKEEEDSSVIDWVKGLFDTGDMSTEEKVDLDTGRLGRLLGVDVAVPQSEFDDLEKTVEQRADARVEEDPTLDYDKAYGEELLDYRKEGAVEGLKNASLGLTPVRVGGAVVPTLLNTLKGQALLAGGTGAVAEIAEQGLDASSEYGQGGRDVSDRVSDVLFEASKDAALTAALGKAGEKVADWSGSALRSVFRTNPASMKTLNEAGDEAKDAYAKYRKKEEVIRKEVNSYKDVVDEETLSKMYKSKQNAAFEDIVRKELKSMPGTTADDIVAALNKAEDLTSTSLSSKGFVSGTKSLADQLQNPTLRKEILNLARKTEKGEGILSMPGIKDALGLGSSKRFSERASAIQEGTSNLNKDLSALLNQADELSTSKKGSELLKEAVSHLKAANNFTAEGSVAKSKEAIGKVNKILSDKTYDLGNVRKAVINGMKGDIQTMNKVQASIPGGVQSTASDLLRGASAPALFGVGSVVLNELSPENAALGAMLGFGVRGVSRKISSQAYKSRLNQVKKALSGKYPVDSTIEKLIKDGEDVAKVIAFATLRSQAVE